MKNFTREDTKFIKGIAIILMFYHHLFCFPDRIGGVSYFSLFSLQGHTAANIIGSFGKICVALFVFLSGYGTYIATDGMNGVTGVITKKICRLYKTYWEVFVVFIPLCFLVGAPNVNKSLRTLILNFTGLEITYNGEISFFTPFVMLMIYTPIILWISKKIKNVYAFGLTVFASSLLGLYVIPNIANTTLGAGLDKSFFYPILTMPFPLLLAHYMSGIFCAKYNILSKIKEKYSNNILASVVAVVVCAAVVYMRQYNGVLYDYIYAPLFIMTIIVIFENKIGRIVRKPIEFIGKHSTIMWLSHSFYCYYLIQPVIFFPRWSFAIVLLLILITLATSLVMEFVFGKLGHLFSRLK